MSKSAKPIQIKYLLPGMLHDHIDFSQKRGPPFQNQSIKDYSNDFCAQIELAFEDIHSSLFSFDKGPESETKTKPQVEPETQPHYDEEKEDDSDSNDPDILQAFLAHLLGGSLERPAREDSEEPEEEPPKPESGCVEVSSSEDDDVAENKTDEDDLGLGQMD
ncbi:hypothetical protein BLNAU_1653 [Blattamonas nauphoetae]|uniref:Uncharacterized protein n=1 Tax=Blattamonas nauphoetae TaxID=2049346 RepID=A0ABQ9YHA4_9EUKA|nr:hypothetical protein BLNAU_1653 [Blattamonas nauphoetae]